MLFFGTKIFTFFLTLMHLLSNVRGANISVSCIIQKSITFKGPTYIGVNMASIFSLFMDINES